MFAYDWRIVASGEERHKTPMLESLPVLINIINALADLAKKQKNTELECKLIEARQVVFQLQDDLQNLRNSNTELRVKVAQLEQALNPSGRVVYAESVYWVEREDGKRDGPYCPICYDAERRFIRLNPAGNGVFSCTLHVTVFKTAEHKIGEVLIAKRGFARGLADF